MAKKDGNRVQDVTSDEVVLREGNISLILDSYDDIFSDFDPRPYSGKALSDDFLLECKKASSDKEKKLELRLLVPKHKRNLDYEAQINKRLKHHFQKHYKEKQEEKGKIRKQGLLLSAIGTVLILGGTLLYDYRGFIFNLIRVILEPSGWFTMWTGLEKIFYSTTEKLPDLEFYKKMAVVKINFYSY